MPSKTKPKAKTKPKGEPVQLFWSFLLMFVKFYEQETGAKANQVRLIDFIRWWEEREKSS